MSKTPAFRQLQAFIKEETTRKPRNTGKSKTETANELTKRIVKYVRANGGFATRLQSTGTYRADIKKFVASQQVSGMPDVLICLNSHFIGVEIKVGRDILSEAQKQTHKALSDAGAWIYVAHDFDAFTTWFQTNFLTPPFA